MWRPSHGLVTGAHRVKLNAVDERLLVYWPRMRGPVAQRLAIGFAGSSDVLLGDRREWDKLDGVDLDFTEAGPSSDRPA